MGWHWQWPKRNLYFRTRTLTFLMTKQRPTRLLLHSRKMVLPVVHGTGLRRWLSGWDMTTTTKRRNTMTTTTLYSINPKDNILPQLVVTVEALTSATNSTTQVPSIIVLPEMT